MPRVFSWKQLLVCLLTGLAWPVFPGETPMDNTGDACTIADVAAEFRALRAVKGHFGGGAWNAAVDRWMGRKHRVMIQLQSRLSDGRYETAQIVEWLGSPDRSDPADYAGYDFILRYPELGPPADGSYGLLVYFWRGSHDFLYFVSYKNIIVDSGWWYAGE